MLPIRRDCGSYNGVVHASLPPVAAGTPDSGPWRFRPRDHALVRAIPGFQDNYFWMIRSPEGRSAAVVDPGDAAPVEAALVDQGLELTAILLTHHHADHVGGVEALRARHPGVRVFGPAGEDIPGVDQVLLDGDVIEVPGLGMQARILEVPGHTRGHIAYFVPRHGVEDDDERPLLFCGDTLFAAGCGRLFEGSPAQMLASLDRLAACPPDTLVYCAHEYTESNLRFACAAEPTSTELIARQAEARRIREAGRATVPSSIDIERRTNPFLRSRLVSLRDQLDGQIEAGTASDVDFFAALRRWKDSFR